MKYYFTPYIGEDYAKGFDGYKTLVVGVVMYCGNNSCLHRKFCGNPSTIDNITFACPNNILQENKVINSLKNATNTMVDNFLNDCHKYPSFESMTSYMTQVRGYWSREVKESFWKNVAFQNYCQHISFNELTMDYKGNEEHFNKYYDGFCEVLSQLNPDIMFVWSDAVKDCLVDNCKDYKLVGLTDMQTISMYLFVSKNVKSQEINRLKYRYRIQPNIKKWYYDYVKRIFKMSNVDIPKDKLDYLASRLVEFEAENLIFSTNRDVYFNDQKWTTPFKGLFLYTLKEGFQQWLNLNTIFCMMFNDDNLPKYNRNNCNKDEKLYEIVTNFWKDFKGKK